jgi:hypothetical protein
MQYEIDNIQNEYLRTKGRQFDAYTQKAHTQLKNRVIGYIADVTELNKARHEYNVTIPELNNVLLRAVPVNLPPNYISANGVGLKPFPLRTGQPVVVGFLNGRTTHPVIDGSFFINGQPEIWENSGPGIDTKDTTGLSLYPTPINNFSRSKNNEVELRVYPLLTRISGTQSSSPVGAEIPGNFIAYDYYGNSFSHNVGQSITSNANSITVNEGEKEHLADTPQKKALLKITTIEREVLEQLAYWRTAVGGKYEISTPHPANKSSKSKSLNISSDGISGFLQISTGFKIADIAGSKRVDELIKKVDNITDILQQANKISNGHLDFLVKNVMPVINFIKQAWSSFNKGGTVNLSFDLPLPLNLNLSVSITYDFKTGKIGISGKLNTVNKTIIPGPLALPLRYENNLLTGVTARETDQTIIIKTLEIPYSETSLYDDYPVLNGYFPNQDTNKIIYELPDRDNSTLNFTENPQDFLITLLQKYGVSNPQKLIKYLVPLVNYGSTFDFLLFSSILATPLEKVLISIGVIYIDSINTQDLPTELNEVNDLNNTNTNNSGSVINPNNQELINQVKEVVNLIIKPGQTECTPVTRNVYRIIESNINTSTDFVNYIEQELFEEVPDYLSWQNDLENFLDWLEEKQTQYYPAIRTLFDGDLEGFLLILIFLSTGVDIRAYPQTYSELLTAIKVAFNVPQLGLYQLGIYE